MSWSYIKFIFILFSFSVFFSCYQKKCTNVRELASFDLSDSVIVSGGEDLAVRRGRQSGDEVGVPLAGQWTRGARGVVVREHAAVSRPDKKRFGRVRPGRLRDSGSGDGLLRTLQKKEQQQAIEIK